MNPSKPVSGHKIGAQERSLLARPDDGGWADVGQLDLLELHGKSKDSLGNSVRLRFKKRAEVVTLW